MLENITQQLKVKLLKCREQKTPKFAAVKDKPLFMASLSSLVFEVSG